MSQPPQNLRRVLGRRDVLCLAFGAMIGWGWVVLAGEIIGRAGTLGAALAFIIGAVMVGLVGMTYAELTSMLSRAGGELSFTYAALGPRLSYVCGWTLLLAYVAVCAFEAVAIATVIAYLVDGFGMGRLYAVAGWDVYTSFIVVGVMGSIAIGAVNYFGVQMAAFVQWSAVFVLFLIGFAFFIPGNTCGDSANLAPRFTGLEGMFRVVLMTPFLFLGFDVIPQVAEEIDIPFSAVGKVLLLAILLALVWYVLVHWTVGLTLDSSTIADRELPTADAMSKIYGSPWGGRVLVFGGLLGLITSWNAFFIGATRLFFAMARGGMLPSIFGRLHPRYESPVAAIILVTILSVVAPFVGRPVLVWLVNAGSLATVVAYFLVALSFVKMRRTYPSFNRPYQAPFPGLTGWLAVLSTLFFVALYLPGSPIALVWPYEWVIIIGWTVLGVLFVLGTRNRVRLDPAEQADLILGPYARQLTSDSEQSVTCRE